MGGQSLGAAWTTCGNCGLPLKNRRAICQSCGAVVPIDRAWTRIKHAIRKRAAGAGLRREQTTLALWLLAVTPLLVAPPLVAMLLVWKRRAANSVTSDVDPSFLTIVAIGNVVFSVIVLLKFRSEGMAFLDWLLAAMPGGHQAPAGHPQLTPI